MKDTPLIITHANCMDGCCCEAILRGKYGDEARYLALDHSNLDESKDSNARVFIESILRQNNSEVVISDFCLPIWMLDKLLSQGNKIVVLDHHIDNWAKLSVLIERKEKGENLNLEVYFSHDNSESGAMLTWKYLNEKAELKRERGGAQIPLLVEHVSAGDVWQFKLGIDTKYFYTGLLEEFKEPKNVPKEVWQELLQNEKAVKKYIDFGAPIHELFMEEMRSYAKNAKNVILNGQQGKIVFAPKKYTSDLGNYLSKTGADFGLVVFFDENGGVRCSLRSIAPKTVNNIANLFGGGGHPQASAFIAKNINEFKALLVAQGNDIDKLFKEFEADGNDFLNKNRLNLKGDDCGVFAAKRLKR